MPWAQELPSLAPAQLPCAQCRPLGQCTSWVQCTQAPEAAQWAGPGGAQSWSVAHAAQVLAVARQTGLAAGQSALCPHSTQEYEPVRHLPVGQSASLAQPAKTHLPARQRSPSEHSASSPQAALPSHRPERQTPS